LSFGAFDKKLVTRVQLSLPRLLAFRLKLCASLTATVCLGLPLFSSRLTGDLVQQACEGAPTHCTVLPS
jgi:hypothetical protein